MIAIDYEWRLREVMASRGMYTTTKLIPLLRERGVELSSSQIYRLVAEKPERLNLLVLSALVDILSCPLEEILKPVRLGVSAQATGTDDGSLESGAALLRQSGLRPTRAKISPFGDE